MTAVSVGAPSRRPPAAAAHDPGWSVHDAPSDGVHRSLGTGTEHLTRWELSAILDDAVLATGELPADAVRHASDDPVDTADPAGTADIVLERSGREPRVTLAAPSPAPPRRRAVVPSAESGRGLSLAAPADDRGTDASEPGDAGKKVWFPLSVREPM